MKSGNREFEIVYSKSEMKTAVASLKAKGFNEQDIHVMANDKTIVESASDAGVHAEKANSISSSFKSLLRGKDSVGKELDRLNLNRDRADDYKREIEKGAILLYTDGQTGSPEDEHFSSLDDSNNPMDLESEPTGNATFGKAALAQENHSGDEIYTREVSREDQHARSINNDRFQDSRLKGDEIHPTAGLEKDEESIREKEFDHEPGLQTTEGEENLLREEGVNRRQSEPSPGVDPNLGPAPFGRDSKEEKLLNDKQSSNFEHAKNPEEHREIESKKNKDNLNPPSQRFF